MRKIVPIPTGLMIKHMALMALQPKPSLEVTSLQRLRANRDADRRNAPRGAA